ncbi:MAG: CHASE domain-containing protein [Syntrophobacter sp.]
MQTEAAYPRISYGDYSRKVIALAATYLVFAAPGILSTIPHGYATGIWPASGIALSFLLIWGQRLWPGVFLGAFGSCLWIAVSTGGATVFHALSSSAIIGAGATLQAIFGVFLINRFVDPPPTLAREWDAIAFLTLGGPVSCLVGSTISITCLAAMEMVSGDDFLFKWWTWWLGDSIGVMVMAPAALTLAPGWPDIWRRRRISMALPLLVMFGLFAFLLIFLGGKEQERIRSDFERRAELVGNQTEMVLREQLQALYSVDDFFAASEQVGRTEFRVFLQHWFEVHKGLLAMNWVPRVRDEERSDYEERARREGYADFRITERLKDGARVERARVPEYYPIYYTEPREPTERVLGFDLASDEIRLAVMKQAATSGWPVATGELKLLGGENGFLISLPIYDRTLRGDDASDREKALKGFAMGVFRIHDVMRAAFPEVRKPGESDIEVEIHDKTVSEAPRLLYHSGTVQDDSNRSSVMPRRSSGGGPWFVARLEFAGRLWEIGFWPTPKYLAEHPPLQTCSILAGGFFFIALSGFFLLITTGYTARVETQVQERTAALECEIKERTAAERKLELTHRLLEERVRERTHELRDANQFLADEIVERRRVENELRQEFAFRDAIIAHATEGLFVCHRLDDFPHLKFTVWNRCMEEITGYSMEEINRLGWTETMFDGPAMREFSRDCLRKMFEGETIVRQDRTIRRADGELRTVILSGSSIKPRHGKIHLVGLVQDVTELKTAEKSLRESETQFRDLVENVRAGVLILRGEEIIYQNPEQARLVSGLSASYSASYPLEGLVQRVHPDDRTSFKAFIASAGGGERHQPETVLRLKPPGEEESAVQWVSCGKSSIEYRGDPAVLITMMDITQLKNMERHVMLREKMASLGHVAAGIAHEIRNPLCGINVYLDAIRDNFQDPENTEDVQQLIREAQATSNKIEMVIKRVLDFSRPTELKLRPIRVDEAIHEAAKLASAALRKSSVMLELDIPRDMPRVFGDVQLIEQVILNLISNAASVLKGKQNSGSPGGGNGIRNALASGDLAAERGDGESHDQPLVTGGNGTAQGTVAPAVNRGEGERKAPRIRVATAVQQGNVLIRVEDSGPGIPVEMRDKVFEPFFTTGSQGMGIGLGICRRIIADHKGEISVSSSSLGGAQFNILIPIEKRKSIS